MVSHLNRFRVLSRLTSFLYLIPPWQLKSNLTYDAQNRYKAEQARLFHVSLYRKIIEAAIWANEIHAPIQITRQTAAILCLLFSSLVAFIPALLGLGALPQCWPE